MNKYDEEIFLVMNSFSGRFLEEQLNGNIGHECMNFFLPDNTNGNFLLWFTNSGKVNKTCEKSNGKITLLIVTNENSIKNGYRVLAKAENCQIVDGATIESNEKQCKEQRREKSKKQFGNSNYNNVNIIDIFKNNTYKGKPDPDDLLATFFTNKKNVYVPKEITIISISEDSGSDIMQNMANEKMRLYVKDKEKFVKLINNIKWLGFDDSKNMLPGYPRDSSKFKPNNNLFVASGNERDELSISNILAYSFKNNPQLLMKFLNKYGISSKDLIDIEYHIERELKHVDITIILRNTTIIIENKIDSSIVEYENKEELKEKLKKANQNLIKKDSSIQTDIENHVNRIGENEKICQLTKYYIQSLIDKKQYNWKDIKYFFLVPNFCTNKFKYDKITKKLTGFALSKNYTLIEYSDIYDIFSSVSNYDYRDDILSELEMLKKQVDDSIMNKEIYKFLKKCNL